MIEINLVPDVKQELIKAQRIRSTVITASIIVGLASIVIIAVLAFYIFAVQWGRGVYVDDEITKKGKELTSVQDLAKTLTIQNQLTKISALNSDKKIDSRMFDLLVAIIPIAPNTIQISDLTIDSATNSIIINGQASNSYAAVEVFKKTIGGVKIVYSIDNDKKEQEKVIASNISTSNTSYGEDSSGVKVLRFTISFNYTPELFSPMSKDIKIVLSEDLIKDGNVTDSYLGVPTSIFTFSERAKDLKEGQ